MFSSKSKRCVASLLIAIIVVGLFSPTTIYAKGTNLDQQQNIDGFGIIGYKQNSSATLSWLGQQAMVRGNGSGDVGEYVLSYTTSDFTVKADYSTNAWFASNIYSEFSDTTFTDVETMITSISDTFPKTQGASSGSSLSTLLGRTAVFTYFRMHPDYLVDNYGDSKGAGIDAITNTEYQSMLTSTVDEGHPQSIRKVYEDILGSNGTMTAKKDTKRYGMSVARPDGASDIATLDTPLACANDYALKICLSDFCTLYTTNMVEIASTESWQDNPESKAVLAIAKQYAETFGKIYPMVKEVYEEKNTLAKDDSDKPMSLKDMAELAEVTEDDITDVNITLDINYESVYDQQTPIEAFYRINSETGIVDYDRDSILNDIEVDEALDLLLSADTKEQNNTNSLLQENIFEDVNELDASDSEAISSTSTRTEQDGDTTLSVLSGQSHSNLDNEDTYDVDDTGKATSSASVTMSDYIIEGMGYSATYMPMKTNLYSVDVINQYSDDYKEEFFYKYGFFRKALLIDTSATSAVDYYTAGGKTTGTTRVCTLRDLIESGDKDVTLYIDSSFYNGETVKEEATNYLQANLKTQQSLEENLTGYTQALQLYQDSKFFDSSMWQSVWDHVSNIPKALYRAIKNTDDEDTQVANWVDEIRPEFREQFLDKYKVDIDYFADDTDDLNDFTKNLSYANNLSADASVTDQVLKDNDASSYDDTIRSTMSEIENTGYLNLIDLRYDSDGNFDVNFENDVKNWAKDAGLETNANYESKGYLTQDSPDSLVLSSYKIGEYMRMDANSSKSKISSDGTQKTTSVYSSLMSYTPMISYAYVSMLYRDASLYELANTVEDNNPVFIASDDLCGVTEAGQWYRNTLLNYALLKNLKSAVQVDYAYVCDLDCPVYMDIVGNIVTESGTVVIPAASNTTLHTGNIKTSNIAIALYSVYGKEYSVPTSCAGAYSVLAPYFAADLNAEQYVINGINLTIGGSTIYMNRINQYAQSTLTAVQDTYKTSITEGDTTNLNWMAMVKISNEVMRGAPLENIDKDEENLYVNNGTGNKAATVAAIKLENLITSLNGQMSNTLMCIPDFTRNDNTEYWVALLIKLLIVATTIVVIIAIYRDGVAGTLGIKTFWQCLCAVALTVCCLCVVPAIFQLTYYSANKFLLEDEAFRILMVNTEKDECGVEIGMTNTTPADSSDEFALQLDWIDVPWYKEVDSLIFKSGLSHVQRVKLEAYQEAATYGNSDVETYNDGVYSNIATLFESVQMDYTFSGNNDDTQGLYIYSVDDSEQTAGFYSPYYAFLRILTANVNEYNDGRTFYDENGTASTVESANYSYTTRYVSGNRLKTVGLSEYYFTSADFMENDMDIMHLYQIYGPIVTDEEDAGNIVVKDMIKDKFATLEKSYDRALLFDQDDLEKFRTSIWYNDSVEVTLDARVEKLDKYARDFVANNKDMLGKVTDETFIKVMALYMSVKYNQLFGISSANALEIYNLDSNDLLRLCIAEPSEAVLAAPMSYSRYVYNFGGEPAVYAATILTLIMYIGSFIKPLCTVIVYISVFLSIFVFRVVLRKPSANLWGYLVTCLLLCVTNFAHALLLKVSVHLPSLGLSTLGCLIFLIVGQVLYLMFLGYVTGVSLKDWSNLGMSEYSNEATAIRSKFKPNDVNDTLSGRVKHHDDNWDYYSDLVEQHRKRNAD